LNRYVTGLERNSFRIREKSIERPITYFVKESVPISLAVVSDLRQESGTGSKLIADALQRLVESASPDDEFFLISYNPKMLSVETIRRQGSTIDVLPSTAYIPGMRSLEQAVIGGCNRIMKTTGKGALVVVTAGTDSEIVRAYDVLYKLGNASELAPLQFYTMKRSGLPKSSIDLSEKSYLISDVGEIGYYLDLVYSELHSQYILGYSPSAERPAGKGPQIRVDVNSPKGLPKLVARPGKPWYSRLP
jgi:hypothetical protein